MKGRYRQPSFSAKITQRMGSSQRFRCLDSPAMGRASKDAGRIFFKEVKLNSGCFPLFVQSGVLVPVHSCAGLVTLFWPVSNWRSRIWPGYGPQDSQAGTGLEHRASGGSVMGFFLPRPTLQLSTVDKWELRVSSLSGIFYLANENLSHSRAWVKALWFCLVVRSRCLPCNGHVYRSKLKRLLVSPVICLAPSAQNLFSPTGFGSASFGIGTNPSISPAQWNLKTEFCFRAFTVTITFNMRLKGSLSFHSDRLSSMSAADFRMA